MVAKNRLPPYTCLKHALTIVMVLACSYIYAQTSVHEHFLKKYRSIKSPDSSKAFAIKLIAMAQKQNDKLFEAQVWYARSFKQYLRGDELTALEMARKAASLTNPKDSVTYVKSATMQAYMLSRRGKDIEGLKIAFKMLEITEAKGWKRLGADCRLCIADLYRTMNKAKQALPYAEKAAEDMLAAKDTAMYIFALSTLSNLYSDDELESKINMAKAAEYMEIILNEPYLSKLSFFEETRYLSNLGRIYQMMNRLEKASKVLTRSIEMSRQGHYPAIEKHALNELATVKIEQGKYQEAIKYAQQALDVQADAQSSRINQRDIYYQLKNAYVGLKNYEMAFKYAEKAHRLSDSITEIEKLSEATRLSEQYKLDKRLLETSGRARLAKQQRNFFMIAGIVLVIAGIIAYWWVDMRRKRKVDLLAREHRQLEKLDALKTRFFSNISHELRTPLTLILGPLDQMVNDPTISGKQHQMHLHTVWRNSKKLLGMVNELLDLGKVEAGGLPINMQPVNLVRFIKMLHQGFASAAEFKKIRYSVVCDIGVDVIVEIDRQKVEKMINNLLGNAIKFTPPGGGIYMNAVLKNDFFEFSVANSGTGIHPDDLPYIFDRYYQGSAEGSIAEGGTGVGLAITKEFAELLGGKIAVENDWGKGTVFIVSIPVKIYIDKERVEPVAPARFVDVDIDTTVPRDRNGVIMVVEDHREMSAYIASILNRYYHIIPVYNGGEALEKLENISAMPNLIISDVMMPVMDGFTMLEKLKQHPRYFRIPIIMLTALADPGNKLKALSTGVDDYVTKPFVSSELLARADNLINNAAQRLIPDDATVKPDDEVQSSPADLQWLASIEKLVRANIKNADFNIAMLSYEMAISERQLNRRIKSITGLTPNKYIRAIRLQIAREAIESGRYRTVAEISYAAGFDTPAYFSKLFKEHYGRDVIDLL